MLHIILTLLKIIGIFLLILLGIFLFLLIAVLAAPISYELSGGWDQTPHLKGRINWLYHIVGVSLSMKNGGLSTRITLFGRSVGNTAGPENTAGQKTAETQPSAESAMPFPKIVPEEKESVSETASGEEKEPVPETVHGEEEESVPETVYEEEEEPVPETVYEEEEEPVPETVYEEEEEPVPETVSETKEELSEIELLQEPGFEEDYFEEESEWEDILPETDSGEKTAGENTSVRSLISRGLDFINMPSVRRLFGKLWKSVRRIIRHLLPSELLIRAVIGTDDPAFTGKIMELAAVFYAFYGDSIEVISDFDQKVLKATVSVKGRLVPGYLIIKILGMALRILLNKECRVLYRDIKENLT